jgi:hypothetical protein
MWWECSECGNTMERAHRPIHCPECGMAGALFVAADPPGDELREFLYLPASGRGLDSFSAQRLRLVRHRLQIADASVESE